METGYSLAITGIFLDQKRVNVCEHAVMMAPCEPYCECGVEPSCFITHGVSYLIIIMSGPNHIGIRKPSRRTG